MGSGKTRKAKRERSRREDFSPSALTRAMRDGAASYGRKLGRWWLCKAGDEEHERAYRQIARWLGKRLPRAPRSILDYACGAGHLTAQLRKTFPGAAITGYDGARRLLKRARKRMKGQPRLELREMLLPDLEDSHPRVDLTVLCLPHLLPPDDGPGIRAYARSHPKEAKAARRMTRSLREAGHWDTEEPEAWQVGNLLFERMAARHLWGLTKRKGHCVRVDYTEAKLGEIEPTYRAYLRFAQGYCASACGVRVKRLFRLAADHYRESAVIGDVADHTGDSRDEGGGYFICLLETSR